ncbi:MAG TPA: dihydropteroate synthase [Chitinophaga sp.]|uniref:dihydropteroate synthase n=1 Tax=Chitinophaga sp. TaxID=1869181 RepID=UPI002DB5EF7A|nr:dihydropteroate synthase [Chitinophaga sp.]HEU4551959.1 dihydropteroate synthase [Chitinophaga sp.]
MNLQPYTINCRGQLLDLSTPMVMGIINITDDSFYAESRSRHLQHIIDKAGQHLAAGARILDLGAQSTRPGAATIGVEEELDRLLPAIHGIINHYPEAIISVDTYYAAVAEKTVQAGAAIVNDISAGELDRDMLATVARLQVPYIAMHMKGTPATMQKDPQYEDVTREVLDYFIQKVAQCRAAGINDVIIDPGFGFGKTLAHNYTLLRNLAALHLLECPLLVGVSRKSMIYRLLNTTADAALNGTTVIHTLALQHGAHLLRVHDVREAVETVRVLQYMNNNLQVTTA